MQIRKPVAAILSVVFALPAQTDTVSIRELALATQVGSTVEVRLAGKARPNKLRGRMGLLNDQAFELAIESSAGEFRSIAFDQVESLRLVKKPRVGSFEQGLTPEAMAQAIAKGTLVEVRFTSRHAPNWLRGRISQAGSQEFQVQVFRAGRIDMQTVRFAEVESIKPVESLWVSSAPLKVQRVIGTGVSVALTAVLVLAIVLVVAAKTGHLGG